jgi:hypothetical protein
MNEARPKRTEHHASAMARRGFAVMDWRTRLMPAYGSGAARRWPMSRMVNWRDPERGDLFP